MAFIKKHHRILFFAAWLLINLIQAYTTELFDDEAYYWVYSRFPALGYFDHPPMIAILIKTGYSIFQNEFGVRLLVVLLNTASIFIVYQLIHDRDNKLFYAIAGSVAIAQVGGILAVPDVPLLFFVSLFFYLYQRFLLKMDVWNSILLGICIALMLYTKYHGILIVLLTLFSNVKLFTRYQTYIVTAVALILFAPHIYWQYQNGFPSVQYHLFERNASSYRLNFTLDYIVGQLLISGPIIGWLLIWSAFKHRPGSDLERAMKYSLVGFYIFFLLSTLKGRVEANWTVPSFVALIALSHQYLRNRPQLSKWVFKTLPITLIGIVAIRAYMMVDLPAANFGKDEFHQNKEWVEAVSKKANGQPVVFLNSYQRPSKYWFYGGNPTLGLNTPYYRRNNFNFWPIEDQYRAYRAYVVGDYDTLVLNDTLIAPTFKRTGGTEVPFYYSFMKARITNIENSITSNGMTSSFNIEVPQEYLALFQQTPYDTARIHFAVIDQHDSIRYFASSFRVKSLTQQKTNLTLQFPVRLNPGKYDARFGISSAVPGHPSMNSPGFKLEIDQ